MAQAEDPTIVVNVVAGIVLLNKVRCRTLFDIGASHSCISRSFVSTHRINIEEVVPAISV